MVQALKYAKQQGALCVGVTNTVGSAIATTTDCGIHVNAGCEIGVASTKAYTSQIVAITLLALVLAEDSVSRKSKYNAVVSALRHLPDSVRQVCHVVSNPDLVLPAMAKLACSICTLPEVDPLLPISQLDTCRFRQQGAPASTARSHIGHAQCCHADAEAGRQDAGAGGQPEGRGVHAGVWPGAELRHRT
jgi:SIS domain